MELGEQLAGHLWLAALVCCVLYAASAVTLRDPMFVYVLMGGVALTGLLLLGDASIGRIWEIAPPATLLVVLGLIGIHVERAFTGRANLFATTFFFNGLQQLAQWVQTGHLERPDLLIAVPAWFANLLVVVGCLWGYRQAPAKTLGDAGRLFTAFALTTGFLALDMAVFQPHYLGLFARMLHPHLP